MFEKYLNKLEKKITDISNRNYKPEMFSIEWLLVGISNIYELLAGFRIWLYTIGFFKQKKLPCFIISIGNIVVGGTGKTPMAIYVAQALKNMGKKAVVISRGYRGKYENSPGVVSDGNTIFLSAMDAGDEPYMMARRRSFPVVVGKDRFKAGMKAMDAFNPDVMVLDDGFQHLKLKRDLDLLLLDYSNPLGNKRFLPAGRLRETPQSFAHRPDAIIFTRSLDRDDTTESFKAVLEYYPGCPWFKTFHRPFIFKQMIYYEKPEEPMTDMRDLKDKKAVLFSGLAKNRSFYHAMEELGVNILDHLEFKDHYRYKKADILLINTSTKKVCADVILTTEKDWAKLDPDIKWALNLIVIGIQIEFEEPEKFDNFLISELESNE